MRTEGYEICTVSQHGKGVQKVKKKELWMDFVHYYSQKYISILTSTNKQGDYDDNHIFWSFEEGSQSKYTRYNSH